MVLFLRLLDGSHAQVDHVPAVVLSALRVRNTESTSGRCVRSRSKAGLGLAAREALKQPTWCLLHPDGWKVLAARASRARPEVLLFTRKRLEQKALVAAAAASRPGQRAVSRSIKDPHRGPGSGRSSTPQAGGPASDGVPRGGRSPGLTASSQ